MVFQVFNKLRRSHSKQAEIERKKTNDTSLGDTIPTKHQFYLETPVKQKPPPEAVEKILLSFGHAPGEGIRSSSTVSSLSSNSASTYDLPRRKSIEEDSNDDASSTRAAHPLTMCAPQYFESAAPPLEDAKHVPSTFWSIFFECCHPSLEAEPTYQSSVGAPTDKTLFGRFLPQEDRDDGETNEQVLKRRGVFRAWTRKSQRAACGACTDEALPTEKR
jgi:hypothetical protein